MEDIDEEWLQELLSRKLNVDVGIVDWVVTSGSGNKGDNYASTTAKIKVTYRTRANDVRVDGGSDGMSRDTQTTHLFAKFLPTSEGQRDFILRYGLFDREAVVYNELVPEMRALFPAGDTAVDAGPEMYSPVPCPDVYKADDSQIIMEDLGSKGFRMGDRKGGLNIQEMTVGLQALARFHASSYVLTRSSGLSREEFKSKFAFIGTDDLYEHASIRPLYADTPAAKRMVDACRAHALEYGLLSSEEADRLIPRLESYAQLDLPERVKNLLLWECHLDCFIMGDCWVNNMMFRYEINADGTETPVEAYLLDFQLVRFSSILIDIAYFIYLSADPKAFRSQEELLRGYHDEFLSCLQTLGFNGLTRDSWPLSKMLEEYREREEAGLLISIAGLPLMALTNDDFPNDFGEGDFGEELVKVAGLALEGPAGKKILRRFMDHARRAADLKII